MRNYSVNWAAATFLLLYVFSPTAFGGIYFVLFSLISFSLAYLILRSIKIMQFEGIFIAPSELMFLMAMIALSVTITLTINAAFFTAIGLSDIAKPIIAMIFFVFAVNSNLKYSIPEIKKTLVLVSKIIIVGQIIAVVDQVFDINALSVIYDYEKTGSTQLDSSGKFKSFLRSTGTLYNPNYFAWIILQCGVTIFSFSRKTSRYFWLFLVFLMILLSGSKSTLGVFPIALLIAGWMKGERDIASRKNIYILVVISLLVFSVYQFLIAYPDFFPRLYVLFQLLTGEDESGGGRFEVWEIAYANFLSKEEGLISWGFGMGPIREFKVLDNGYLYTFFRTGIIGLLLHVALLIYFMVTYYRFYDRELGALGVQYIVIGAMIQLVMEAHVAWSYLPYTFLYAGLVYSYVYRYENTSLSDAPKSKIANIQDSQSGVAI